MIIEPIWLVNMVVVLFLVETPLGDDAWKKVLMTEYQSSGAVCLDGSPGGFYFKQGTVKKWVIFHQGGGWCTSSTNCLGRASSNLGSSINWGPTYTDKYEGSELFATHPFNQFNIVYAMYCDGGSWAGNTEEVVNGTTVYYRGRLLLDAMIAKLMQMGLGDAEELLYSGCSAGGLTAYLHTDYVRSQLPTSVKVLGLADAMFSLEHNSFANVSLFQSRMQWVYTAMNATSLNENCSSHYGHENSWKCLFGANVVKHVSTPMFILNSKYDTWQEKAILGLQCAITKCNATEEAFWITYGREMLQQLNSVPDRHSAFISNCPAHCQTGTGGNWNVRRINGTSIANAVSQWYNATISINLGEIDQVSSMRWVETCDEKPCGTDVC